MPELLLLNGPNLGILGRREPAVYGTTTLDQVTTAVTREMAPAWTVRALQSEHEGTLVEAVNAAWHDSVGVVVNPGALMMAGWSLRDSLAAYPHPVVEVHLSNLWQRESFRHASVIAPVVDGVVVGLGALGYVVAARALRDLVAGGRELAP